MVNSLYELSFIDNHGKTVELSQFRGKPVLVVNTASKCGLTPHYEGLQAIHQKYAERGLVVLGFPCDQFGHQEPGTDSEIEQFCQLNYGVTFPLSQKIEVNGGGTHPIFKFVRRKSSGFFGSAVKWNFTKFLVSSDGQSVQRFAPTTKPEELIPAIESLLK